MDDIYLSTTLVALRIDMPHPLPQAFWFGRPPVCFYRLTPAVYGWLCRMMAAATKARAAGKLTPEQWQWLSVQFREVYAETALRFSAAELTAARADPEPRLPEPAADLGTVLRGLEAVAKFDALSRAAGTALV